MKQPEYTKGLILILLSCIYLFSACIKTIEIPLVYDSKVVIESILTQDSCYAIVSRSISYSDTSRKLVPVEDAVVLVGDGTNEDSLSYTEDGVYTNSKPTIAYQYGQSYSTTVTVSGKTYTATSNLPIQNPNLNSAVISLRDTMTEDSIVLSRIGRLAINFDVRKDSKYWLRVWANGKEHKDIELYNSSVTGAITYRTDLLDLGLLSAGTSIKVMLCQLPDLTYEYLYSLLSINENIALPSIVGTYVQPISVFDNGGLGYFAAITTDTMSLVVP
ncbi:MAG: DUF4249 family protein [Aureispira sp.]|nr:DUF4249 family protein [Aureispira sp.]